MGLHEPPLALMLTVFGRAGAEVRKARLIRAARRSEGNGCGKGAARR